MKIMYNEQTREVTMTFQLQDKPKVSSTGRSFVYFSTNGFKRLRELDDNKDLPNLQVSMNLVLPRREAFSTEGDDSAPTPSK